MTTELMNRDLPKWPQMRVTGKRLEIAQAKEIIRRTDSFFRHYGRGGNDHNWNRSTANSLGVPYADYIDFDKPWFNQVEFTNAQDLFHNEWQIIDTDYVHNDWMSSCHIYGPYGWCNPSGRIYYCFNVGKWPDVQAVFNDWLVLANHFEFLDVGVTLMNGEHGAESLEPVVSMRVLDGQVVLIDPAEHNVHEDHEPWEYSPGSMSAAFDTQSRFLWEHGIPRTWIDEWAKHAKMLGLV